MDIKIIISPAKKMKIDNHTIVHRKMPIFLKEAAVLLDYLQSLDYRELKSIWKCSDKLAKENFAIVKNMDLHSNLTPAILSFEGLQYKYMGAGVFTYDQLDYIDRHLCILSGFYGLLGAFDGIVPYRLEMQAKLIDWDYKSLYDFWKDKIAKEILSKTTCILNLASKEYSKSIDKYLNRDTKWIDCIFGELVDGKVIEKGTFAKMARGEMVRYMAENNIQDLEEIKAFRGLSYSFNEELSHEDTYVFLKGAT